MIIRRRVRVIGQVQGVGYRFTCEREARGWRVAGWVTNSDDGSVEAVFEGSRDAVTSMIDWCRRGPTHARVDHVEVTEEDPTGDSGFAVV